MLVYVNMGDYGRRGHGLVEVGDGGQIQGWRTQYVGWTECGGRRNGASPRVGASLASLVDCGRVERII